MLPLWIELIDLWSTDPLRSIGAFFPILAFAGVILTWRRLGWEIDGNWWGLALVILAAPLARLVSHSSLFLVHDGHRIGLLHQGAVVFLYGIGAALLFGGVRLVRAALGPLLLLLLVNPVPRWFNAAVDLPLQQAAANAARGFSKLIGLHPTGEEVRMMFAPDFGMMIVPGCNGMRGAITLACLAMIFGFLRGLRPRRLAAVTAGALLLGYLLNFLRLCLLVIYYRIGVEVTSVQNYGTQVDYAIGSTLFLGAALLLGVLIRRIEPSSAARVEREAELSTPVNAGAYPARQTAGRTVWMRAAGFVLVSLCFLVPEVRAKNLHTVERPEEQAVLSSLPVQVGAYRLVRTFSEHDTNGMIVMGLGEYAGPAQGDRLTLGVWVGPGEHRVAKSRLNQGAAAEWTGSFNAHALGGLPMHMAGSFYDEGVSRSYEAEADCSETGCSDQLAGGRQSGFFFAAPRLGDLVFAPAGARLPVVIEREWPEEDNASPAMERRSFEADATLFLAQLDVRQLIARVKTPASVQAGYQPK